MVSSVNDRPVIAKRLITIHGEKYDDFIQRIIPFRLVIMAWPLRLPLAAESGWLRSPDNDHASIRLRAGTSAGETRLLLDVKTGKRLKTYWRAPKRVAPLYRPERRHA